MKQNNNENNKTLLGTHCWLLGTDVWQLGQKESIKKLFPDHPKLTKLIQIAEILDKHQKEITYYQTRIRGLLETLEKKKHEPNQ